LVPARYVLPSFTERTSYGMKESNPYNKLFEERIIFCGVQIDDSVTRRPLRIGGPRLAPCRPMDRCCVGGSAVGQRTGAGQHPG
jgi:hypothetical protein